MGHILEPYFSGIEECPKCKGKNFKAVAVKHTIYYADKEKETYWTDESGDDDVEDFEVFCVNCGEKIDRE